MCSDIVEAVRYGHHNECVAIVIKAQCNHGVWNEGHDFHELPQDGSDSLANDVPMERMLHEVQEVPIPVIACVNGTVWGDAYNLCLCFDMILASENATFAITPAKIGIPYNASGIMHFINQLGLSKAREMFFLATPIEARDTLKVGLIKHVTTKDKLDEMLEEHFLTPLRRKSVMSISAIKRPFRILSKASATISSEGFERINFYRTRVYQGVDYHEGINDFHEKLAPQFTSKASGLDFRSYRYDKPLYIDKQLL